MVSRDTKRIANLSQIRSAVAVSKGNQQPCVLTMQMRNTTRRACAIERRHTVGMESQQRTRDGLGVGLYVKPPIDDRSVIRSYAWVAMQLARYIEMRMGGQTVNRREKGVAKSLCNRSGDGGGIRIGK